MTDAPFHPSFRGLPSSFQIEIVVGFGDRRVPHGRCEWTGGGKGVVVGDYVVGRASQERLVQWDAQEKNHVFQRSLH